MIKKLSPTTEQTKIASLLGIDISNDTVLVAAARIKEAVFHAINFNKKLYPATLKQIKFAANIGIDCSTDSMLVCSAKIKDKLDAINHKILQELQLNPGDHVLKKISVNIDGVFSTYTQEFIVSSIGKNLRVYFKGTNGSSAWPSELTKI